MTLRSIEICDDAAEVVATITLADGLAGILPVDMFSDICRRP